jgi:uroporphyrin-III C-methyltransferase
VAFVERGSTPEERIVESTLEEVADGLCEVTSPAVFVIGEVVRLRARLTASEEARQQPELAARG